MRMTDKPTEFSLAQHQSRPSRSLPTAAGADTKLSPAKAEERTGPACRKFEGFLLGELLKQMRDSETSGKGLVPVSRAEHIFVRQQCEILGDLLAEREPLGLARMLRSQATEKQTTAGIVRPDSQDAGGTTDAH